MERVADSSLMREWLTPEDVREIAAAFDDCDPALVAEESKDDRYPASEIEIINLRRFFGVCAECGLGLIGWW